jgi:hypothetical protein
MEHLLPPNGAGFPVGVLKANYRPRVSPLSPERERAVYGYGAPTELPPPAPAAPSRAEQLRSERKSIERQLHILTNRLGDLLDELHALPPPA